MPGPIRNTRNPRRNKIGPMKVKDKKNNKDKKNKEKE